MKHGIKVSNVGCVVRITCVHLQRGAVKQGRASFICNRHIVVQTFAPDERDIFTENPVNFTILCIRTALGYPWCEATFNCRLSLISFLHRVILYFVHLTDDCLEAVNCTASVRRPSMKIHPLTLLLFYPLIHVSLSHCRITRSFSNIELFALSRQSASRQSGFMWITYYAQCFEYVRLPDRLTQIPRLPPYSTTVFSSLLAIRV